MLRIKHEITTTNTNYSLQNIWELFFMREEYITNKVFITCTLWTCISFLQNFNILQTPVSIWNIPILAITLITLLQYYHRKYPTQPTEKEQIVTITSIITLTLIITLFINYTAQTVGINLGI